MMPVTPTREHLVRRYQRELAKRDRPAPLRARAAAREHPGHRAHDAMSREELQRSLAALVEQRLTR